MREGEDLKRGETRYPSHHIDGEPPLLVLPLATVRSCCEHHKEKERDISPRRVGTKALCSYGRNSLRCSCFM